MAEAWDDKINKEIVKKNLQKPTPEQVKLFEEKTGLKVIDVEKTILQTDDGIMWRPFKNQAEFLCACWDGVEILNVGKCQLSQTFGNHRNVSVINPYCFFDEVRR